MNVRFVGAFDKVSDLPNTMFQEYAFIGRSNVGKSSLLNAVVGSAVARTSKTPGRTQTLNLFNIGDRIMLVDLPGYGYAKISRDTADRWLARLEEYLSSRRQLKRLFILVDSRVGIKEADLDLMDFCDANGVPYQIVLTKVDKAKNHSIVCAPRPAMVAPVSETSAEKGIGIFDLRKIVGIK